MFNDCLIALLPLYIMAFYYYGWRPVVMALFSVATCVVTDIICVKVSGKKLNKYDNSAFVTGLILPLLLPATVPYMMVFSGAVFAMLVMKHPFGGLGNNPFNPAAGAFAFLAVCWPNLVFSYTVPLEQLPVFGDISAKLMDSPAFTMQLGGIPNINPIDMLLGNYPGPMGATNILVICACFLFLIFRRTIRWEIPLTFVATCALFAFLYPRIMGGHLQSVYYELSSGTLLFAGVFMLTDPVTSPTTRSGRLAFGFLAGMVTMLFRMFGGYEEGVCFAILLMNALSPMLDRYLPLLSRRKRGGVQHEYEV